MTRSMTAFARAGAPVRQGNWNIEIRSVNHRYFEFSLKIPSVLSALENRVRERVQSVMRRGKVTAAINQELTGEKSKTLSIDETAARFYLGSIQKLKKKFKLEGKVTVTDLLRLPGIFSGEESAIDPEKSWPQILKVLDIALEAAVKAKQAEGRKLAKDIEARLETVTQAVGKIEHYASNASARILKKLKDRIADLLNESTIDPERVHREAAFLAERVDITEELVRMKSHLELFSRRLKMDAEVGRELDFLCQEMNREVNTMGSKSQFFEIATEVVLIKGELEKIREQIQNIE